MNHQFDELAKAVAGGVSRREALRRLGGGLAAALLASLDQGKAWSQGNSDCAHFCQCLPPGPERGQCVSDAAHGTGLCAACEGDCARLCHTPSGASICCAGGPTSTCCGGGCTDTTTDANNCGTCGQVCPPAMCVGNTAFFNPRCKHGQCEYNDSRGCAFPFEICVNGQCVAPG